MHILIYIIKRNLVALNMITEFLCTVEYKTVGPQLKYLSLVNIN